MKFCYSELENKFCNYREVGKFAICFYLPDAFSHRQQRLLSQTMGDPAGGCTPRSPLCANAMHSSCASFPPLMPYQ